MDDIDSIEDKELKVKTLSLLSKLLTMGRHGHITVCFANHLPYNGNDTKSILNEAHTTTFFPKTLGKINLKYSLSGYFGLSNEEIDKLSNLDSRWVTIYKSLYPHVILGERNIFIL
jgi:hypothetical protein